MTDTSNAAAEILKQIVIEDAKLPDWRPATEEELLAHARRSAPIMAIARAIVRGMA